MRDISYPPGGHRGPRRGRGGAFAGTPFGSGRAGPWAASAEPAAPCDESENGDIGPGIRPEPGSPGDRPAGPEAFAARGFGAGRGGRGPRGFGPEGFFGPGGFGLGGFGPGGGPGGPGRRGHRGWSRGGRGGRRGNVRTAILALLAEEPRHGYALMTEIAGRSGGWWRPSPGSVYPVLQQLQDEGLVSVEETDGRRVFSLTDAGRAYVAEHSDEVQQLWGMDGGRPAERVQSIMFELQGLGAAVHQVAHVGDDAQVEQAVAALETARRALYRILAGEPE